MGFAADLRKICDKAQGKVELVVRKTALELMSEMVARSPVGDPRGWEANRSVTEARTAYIEGAMDYNEANPGKRRIGTSRAKLDKIFKLSAGQGYVGGRFKNNWQCGLGSINSNTEAAPDKSGSHSLGATKTVLEGWKPGQTIFLCNSLPYSKALEYGHSKTQAPGGMVRLTVQSYQQALAKAVASIK